MFKTLLIIQILISSLVSSTASAQQNDLTIKRGEKAQFDGVLVPEDNYRFYGAKVLEADELDRYIVKDPEPSKESPTFLERSIPFFAGILFGGFGAVYILDKH